jgi:YVTN family beta-propeller protein
MMRRSTGLLGLAFVCALVFAASVQAAPQSAAGQRRGTAGTAQKAYLFVPGFTNNLVWAFDLQTDKQVAAIPFGGYAPLGAYARPDGEKIFVPDGLPDPLSPLRGFVETIDVATAKVEHKTAINNPAGERGTKIAPKSSLFWFSEISSGAFVNGDLEAIDTRTYKLARRCPGGGIPFQPSPNGRWLYTRNGDYHSATLNVRSAQTCRIVASVPIPDPGLVNGVEIDQLEFFSLIEMYLSPDGKKVYLSSAGNPGYITPGNLKVIDVSNPLHPHFLTQMSVGVAPYEASFTPDGRQLWVPNSGDGTVSVVDVRTDTVVRTIDTGRYVGGVAFWGNRAYLAMTQDGYPLLPSFGSLLYTVTAGGLAAPPTGAPTTRPGLDVPFEIVPYDIHRYERLDLPPMKIPGISWIMAIASPPVPHSPVRRSHRRASNAVESVRRDRLPQPSS